MSKRKTERPMSIVSPFKSKVDKNLDNFMDGPIVPENDSSAPTSAHSSAHSWFTENQLKVFNYLSTSNGVASIKKIAQETDISYHTVRKCITRFAELKIISKPIRFQTGNLIGIKFKILKRKNEN